MTGAPLFEDGASSAILFDNAFASVDVTALLNKVKWQSNTIQIFGRHYPEPRLTAWYGPAYRYSSIYWPEQALPEGIRRMANNLSEKFDFLFNAVLLNRYRNGNDAMGWHRDNEPEIDTRLIASISFGARRSFLIRKRDRSFRTSVELEHGSLLLMKNMQEDYEHALPRRRRITEERINLTFRRINA